MRARSLSPLSAIGLAGGIALILMLGLACGGGSSSGSSAAAPPAKAASLAYTDPSGSGWRLVKDASSTPTRLVLDLVGPAGLATRGVGFNVHGAAGLHFAAFPNGLPIQDAGVYRLLSAAADPNEPVAITGGVKRDGTLSVGLYQKDRAASAKDSGAALCRIAIALDAATELHAGDSPALQVVKARAIPEDIGAVTDDAWTLDQKLHMTDISIAVGTLRAQ